MATGRPAISLPPKRINSFATPKPPPEKPRAHISQYNLEWADLKTFLETKFKNYEIKDISIIKDFYVCELPEELTKADLDEIETLRKTDRVYTIDTCRQSVEPP